jgi:hypothetical protein
VVAAIFYDLKDTGADLDETPDPLSESLMDRAICSAT